MLKGNTDHDLPLTSNLFCVFIKNLKTFLGITFKIFVYDEEIDIYIWLDNCDPKQHIKPLLGVSLVVCSLLTLIKHNSDSLFAKL